MEGSISFNMAIIRITNLKLRAIIGTNNWERHKKQTVLINVKLDYNAAKASQSDDIQDALDYKILTKKIIKMAASSQFFLLEKLTQKILDIILEYPSVREARVRVDKPLALRYADSVSIEISKNRKKHESSCH